VGFTLARGRTSRSSKGGNWQPDNMTVIAQRKLADRREFVRSRAGYMSKENEVTQTIEEKNKAFVLEAFETLFNKRDYAAAERFWSPNYIQHSAQAENNWSLCVVSAGAADANTAARAALHVQSVLRRDYDLMPTWSSVGAPLPRWSPLNAGLEILSIIM
jgi:hypothetical protein